MIKIMIIMIIIQRLVTKMLASNVVLVVDQVLYIYMYRERE